MHPLRATFTQPGPHPLHTACIPPRRRDGGLNITAKEINTFTVKDSRKYDKIHTLTTLYHINSPR